MGVRRGCPKFFLKYPAVGADSHSRAADRYFRPPIVRRCASRRRPLPPWGRRREALPPGPEPLGMNPQLRGHFRGRLAAAEPELHGMLLKGLVKLLSDVLGLVHRCIHSCFVHICLALPVSDFSRRPTVLLGVVVAVALLAGCSNGKDRQAAMKRQFATLDSNFIADITAANNRQQASIDEDQQRFSNTILSLRLTLTNASIAEDELTNAVSKETAKLFLFMKFHEQQGELQRAYATNTMLLENCAFSTPIPCR